MKKLLELIVLYVIGVTGFPSTKEHHRSNNGEITPYLSWVAFVDGKAFFVDTITPRNQTEAVAYCSKLGMQLAEIKSESQFLALDQADVEEWRDNWAAWTAGMEITGIHRYIWNNSNAVIDSNLPYRFMNEEARYGVLFRKRNGGSHLFNSPLTALQGTLCETLT